VLRGDGLVLLQLKTVAPLLSAVTQRFRICACSLSPPIGISTSSTTTSTVAIRTRDRKDPIPERHDSGAWRKNVARGQRDARRYLDIRGNATNVAELGRRPAC